MQIICVHYGPAENIHVSNIVSHCGDLTFCGGSRQVDDHVHLPLRLQVDLKKKKEKRKGNQWEAAQQEGVGRPSGQTNTPVHMEQVII